MQEVFLPNPNEVRRKIRDALKRDGMTQKELASRIKISESTLSGFMNKNRSLAYETIHDIWTTFQESTPGERTAADLMEPEIVWAHPNDMYEEVADTMMENAYTQMPVRENGEFLGWITMEVMADDGELGKPIRPLIHENSLGTIEAHVTERAAGDALTGDTGYRALLVMDGEEYRGILTQEDLVRAKVEKREYV